MIVNAAMIYLAAQVVPGIVLRGKPLWPALLAGLVLALVNAVVRPVLKITHPATDAPDPRPLPVRAERVLPLADIGRRARLRRGGLPGRLLGALLITVVSWALTAFATDSQADSGVFKRRARPLR